MIIFVDRCLLPLANSFVIWSTIFFSSDLPLASPNVVLHLPSSVHMFVHSSIFLLSRAMLYVAINSCIPILSSTFIVKLVCSFFELVCSFCSLEVSFLGVVCSFCHPLGIVIGFT